MASSCFGSSRWQQDKRIGVQRKKDMKVDLDLSPLFWLREAEGLLSAIWREGEEGKKKRRRGGDRGAPPSSLRRARVVREKESPVGTQLSAQRMRDGCLRQGRGKRGRGE